jgi:hypothetical protein
MESGEVDGIFDTWASLRITSLEKFKSGEWPAKAYLRRHCRKPMPKGSFRDPRAHRRILRSAEGQECVGAPATSLSHGLLDVVRTASFQPHDLGLQMARRVLHLSGPLIVAGAVRHPQ